MTEHLFDTMMLTITDKSRSIGPPPKCKDEKCWKLLQATLNVTNTCLMQFDSSKHACLCLDGWFMFIWKGLHPTFVDNQLLKVSC